MKLSCIPFQIVLFLALSARAEAVGAEVKNEAAAPSLSHKSEAEAKLAEVLKKIGDVRQELWVSSMKLEAAAIAKITNLDSAGVKLLEAEAPRIANLCLADWMPKVDVIYRHFLSREPEEALQLFDQLIVMAPTYAQGIVVKDYLGPLSHPAWTEAVQRVLTPDQMAAWIKGDAARQEAFKAEIGGYLQPLVNAMNGGQNKLFSDRISTLKLCMKLSKETGEKLESLAKAIVGKMVEAARMTTENRLLAIEPDQRNEVLKRGSFNFGWYPEKKPDDWIKEWKERAAAVFSPDELLCSKAAKEEQAARRTPALAAMAVSLLDEKMALSTGQREQLRPILERAIPGQLSLYPEDLSNRLPDFSEDDFFEAAALAPEAEIKHVLDELQWKRWEELRGNSEAPVAEASQKPAAAIGGMEESEAAISDFLHQAAQGAREQSIASAALQIEDATRAAGLAPAVVGRLQSALRGAVEEALEEWKASADQSVHAQLQGIPAGKISGRLTQINVGALGNGAAIDKKAVWLKTVELELNEEERGLWQKEIEERSRYRQNAICLLILTEFDRGIWLSRQQWDALEILVAETIGDYSPDLEQLLPSESGKWYLGDYMMFFPLAALPENKLKAILSTDQWEAWISSKQFSSIAVNLKNLQTRHQQRLKAAK